MSDRMIRAALAMVASFGVLLVLFGTTGALAQTVNICDRTPQVRDQILQALGLSAGNCNAVNSEGLAGITTLDIGRARLTTLQVGDFAGLTGLQILSLQQNQCAGSPTFRTFFR